MNFWIIFLSLLVGALLGYEFGKWVVSQKMKELLNNMAEYAKKAAEDLKKNQMKNQISMTEVKSSETKEMMPNE